MTGEITLRGRVLPRVGEEHAEPALLREQILRAAGSDLEVFSEKSPMGSAISGHRVGDELSYTTPNGKQIPVRILDAKPFKV